METYGDKKMKRFAEMLRMLLTQSQAIDRRQRILQFITKERVGIEVGPWFAPHGVVPLRTLQEAFDSWKASLAAADLEYRDVHCWAFIPASFELLIRDLQFLTLLNFDILDVSQPVGNEFVVHLR